MQKAQAQNKIKETFENPFEEARFRDFVRNLLNHIEEEDNHPYSGQFIATAFQSYISTLKRIGKYSDGEHEIDILIVQLKKETSLERARTAQRNFIARYLNGSRGGKMKDAALVAFVSPNEMDWRFSFIKMDYKFIEGKNGKTKVKEEFTPARRWSFLVGPNEHSHTAQAKLAPIIGDESVITLARLEEAFNIEKVTKEFFEKYRGLFSDVKEAMDKIIASNADIKDDFDNKFVTSVDFSKRLLGQIVFLYFLQKKGWFGVPKDKKWGEGDKNFLRNLFNSKYLKYKNFYNDILEPLFYDALALDRSHLDHWNDHFQCKIPFLNGGLFDNKYNWHETEIELSNDLFSNEYLTKEKDKGTGILDIFDRYNFTVKEDEPLEKEVAVDPEMLGKVFENLLEVKDRKSKGTYYTPREIVHYMCEQSLVSYLATELQGKVSKEDVEKLIKIGENVVEHEAVSISKEDNPEYGGDYKRLLPDTIKDFANEIDDKLATIKVCDPAIGSGAFPVGMMNAIVKARMVLSSYLKDKNRTLYSFKRDCIQNSLYGVDIDPGAVEIAKLRLWLSLVVDEDNIKQIKPLPNLDYKIMQGNSLLEEFEGIKLFDEKLIAVIDTGKEKQLESIKQKQAVLQKEYFELHSQNKLTPAKQAELNSELKKLQTQVKKLNQTEKVDVEKNVGLFDMYSVAKKKADDLKRLHKEFFEATQKSKKDNIKKQIEQLEWELIEATLKEQGKTSALKKLEEFKRSNTKPFFLWKLNFADVFEEKGGFDVIIANPPYDVYQGHRKDEIEELSRTAMYPLAKGGKLNAYKLFLAKSIQLQRINGMLCEIFQNSFLADNSARNIRKYFIEKQNVLQIDSFPERDDVNRRVFEEVKMSVCILLARNVEISDYSLTLNIWDDKYMSRGKKLTLLKSDLIKFDEANLTIPLASNEEVVILKKVAGFPKLIEVGRCYEGEINLTFHKKYLHKEAVKNAPMIKGAAVQKWHIKKKMSQGEIEYLDVAKFAKENSSPKAEHYLQKRLVMQGITGIDEKYRLKMTMLDAGIFCGNSVNYILMSDISIRYEYLLALLNSRLLNWYFKIFSTNSNVNGYEVNNLPIPRASKADQKPFIDLAEKILKITKEEDYLQNSAKQAKVQDIEHQIDELVYKLYGLTDEDIKIVEYEK